MHDHVYTKAENEEFSQQDLDKPRAPAHLRKISHTMLL